MWFPHQDCTMMGQDALHVANIVLQFGFLSSCMIVHVTSDWFDSHPTLKQRCGILHVLQKKVTEWAALLIYASLNPSPFSVRVSIGNVTSYTVALHSEKPFSKIECSAKDLHSKPTSRGKEDRKKCSLVSTDVCTGSVKTLMLNLTGMWMNQDICGI